MRSKLIGITIGIMVGLFLFGCKGKPVELIFMNLKNADYCNEELFARYNYAVQRDNKPFDDYFVLCKFGRTYKPGIIYGALFKKPIGSSIVKMQLLNAITSELITTHDYDISPDMSDMQTWHNLGEKGNYKINIIVKDEIIAQGFIEYK